MSFHHLENHRDCFLIHSESCVCPTGQNVLTFSYEFEIWNHTLNADITQCGSYMAAEAYYLNMASAVFF